MDAMAKTELGVGYTLTFTREFDAPRELVFRVWTDPVHLARWWGPSGFTNPVCEFEARPGGRIHIEMTGPDGRAYPMAGEVREIVPPERLVLFCTCCGDDSGTPGVEVLNSVTFTEKNGRTVVEVEARVLKVDPQMIDAIAGMEQGWSESLERLAQTVDAVYSE